MRTRRQPQRTPVQRFERLLDLGLGVVSTAMAEVAELGPATLRSRLRRSQLRRVSHGVYAHPKATLAGLTELMALTLWPVPSFPGDTVVVGETALYLRLAWDWDDEMCDTLAEVPIEMAFPPGYRTHRPPPRRYDPTSSQPVRLRPEWYPATLHEVRRTTGIFHRRFRVQHVGPALRACLAAPDYDKARLASWVFRPRDVDVLLGSDREARRQAADALAITVGRGLKDPREIPALLRTLADAVPA
ncbi:hypothetical protein tb265_07080 [Gemmatimonadetes bacterium T265]|nr:hypothetical protein tb265_07080 [Gemmatimonadetes bacterium T265]